MRAGSGLCAGQDSVLNAVPEGGSAGALTALVGPGMVVRWVPGGPGPCLNFLSAMPPQSALGEDTRASCVVVCGCIHCANTRRESWHH